MALKPRTYQQEAADKAVSFLRTNKEPGILSLPTGAGKSIVIAVIAAVVNRAQKRVLVLQPNADLVEQNSAKFRATGNPCSVFSASLNKKNTGHNVVFATPLSVINNLDRFDDSYALLVLDECDTLSENEESVLQRIIAHLSANNPAMRILGLTATPMRGKYKLVDADKTFKHTIFELSHGDLSGMGWTVPFKLGHVSDHYSLADVKLQSNGKFKQSDIDAATLDKERLTRAIVDDVVATMHREGRKCCIFFASSLNHAKEVASYLPANETQVIDGGTAKGTRRDILEETRQGKWRYLVNFGVLTVGTDLPIVDTIALLRATESARLLIQILGRGCRLYDPEWSLPPGEMNWLHPAYQGKPDCLVLDHGENIDRFALDDNITIAGLVSERNKRDAGDEPFYIDCPDCGTPNPHTAVRCVGIKHKRRCEYYFAFKVCQCGAYNAPSARYCRKCKAELVNPEKKLTRAPAIGAGVPIYVEVQSMTLRPHVKKEKVTLRVDYAVQYGDRDIEISEFLNPATTWPAGVKAFQDFCNVTGAKWGSVDDIVASAGELTAPVRLLVQREKGSKYFSVTARYKL